MSRSFEAGNVLAGLIRTPGVHTINTGHTRMTAPPAASRWQWKTSVVPEPTRLTLLALVRRRARAAH